MLKEELIKNKNDKTKNNNDILDLEGDFNTVNDILEKKINIGYEGRINSVSHSFYGEMRDCSKILRYCLKSIIKNQNESDFQQIFVIDNLWKIMLITLETILEYESRKITENYEHNKKVLLNDQERYKKRIQRLDIREKELELEFTIKKEKIEQEYTELNEKKNKLEADLLEKTKLCEELLDPNRFILVNHFIHQFEYKFETSYEIRLDEMRKIQNMLKAMISEDTIQQELNDELNRIYEDFPKSTMLILRKLQERLFISSDEIKYRIKCNQDIINSILDGTFGIKKTQNELIQTDPLKENDMTSKVFL